MRNWILPLLFMLTSCLNESISPEATLKDFVETRLGNTVTRQFVLDRVTGKMKQSFENMSDEDFAKFADLRNVKQNSFKVLTKSCQESKCFLTYSVGYKSTLEKGTYNSDVKKIAEIHHVEGKWLIADVSNIKTYHESVDPINPMD
ncbi:MAG TPA: hypothetical protein VNJ08_10015 [Bacteriovoracaceae bacterium]|nr:hypothetical protein [Bacteriovoracaceae bacterium]